MDPSSDVEMTSWFTVRKLDAQTWAIDDHGNNVLYLLIGSERALLIDTGWGIGDLPALVTSFTPYPLLVVNTHGHPDHVGGDGQFPKVHITTADRLIANRFLSPAERRWAVENKTLPQPFPTGFDLDSWLSATATFVSISGGDIIELGERRLEVIDLPGHSPGSICLLDRAKQWIFGGDSLLHQTIWLHLKESLPLSGFLASLRHLQEYKGAFDTIWPAHGMLEQLEIPASLVGEMIEGIEAILAGEVTGVPEHTFVGDGLRCDFGRFAILYHPERL